MADEQAARPTNPSFGHQVRLEQFGAEVHLIFVASNQERADALVERLLAQLKAGTLRLTMTGGPATSVEFG